MRVVVAMSGGVDSSVAAALLCPQGHDVIGLSMQLYDQSGTQHFGSCCTLDDLHDARRVASALGFPHYILNLEQRFQETVISNFVGEYSTGRTPLPCAHCNSDLKFSTLLERARGFGADRVATGHYARVDRADDGTWVLKRSADPDKDQSYFLFSLTQEQLAGAMFPVGALSKPDVRAEARRLGLAVADKPDSQEICFVPDGDYAAFVERQAGTSDRSGPILDPGGRQIGRHAGVHRFTVGQRRGLGLTTNRPHYVLAVEPATATLVVGDEGGLMRSELQARGVNWLSRSAPEAELRARVRIRHRHAEADATLRPLGADAVDVDYAPNGRPTALSIDWEEDAIDDEEAYTLSGYEALG